MKKSLFCGVLASLFFAFTFILNRKMDLEGGFWVWSASLRYLFMLPMLMVLLAFMKGNRIRAVIEDIRRKPAAWFIWSTVGFGLFYLPLTMAANYGESWMIAAMWQFTIAAGILLTPIFGKKLPVKNLLMSFVIIAGIFLLQIPNMEDGFRAENIKAVLLIIIAAFSYPLGNRKMMQHADPGMDTLSRVFGMTLCSMPFWIAAMIYALYESGMPGGGQIAQSFGVALFSGVIATLLFFHATDIVKDNPKQLAVAEATQCGEVIFTLIGGILFLNDAAPSGAGIAGIVLIIAGMTINSLIRE